ncbi:MAG TPA: geranylgeranylglycerol-phosphate geranylgeranyltransferase [Bacteroidota bacterium]|nr:geranylgeranylglycerol-phosphate geranylgeranyltransferase [Bacteroidota bacterium]
MKNYLILLRPSNFIITVASVFVSCLLAGGTNTDLPAMVIASFAAGFIGGGGMVVNDIFDIEIDRINKPLRPLPSGTVSPRAAAFFYAALTGVGLLLNLFLHSRAQSIALGAAALIFFYSYKLKSTPLVGNLSVGVLTGLTFIYGGAAVGAIGRALVPALFAFLINAGREVVKDMEDLEGDARNNARTFPVVYGMKAASVVATGFLVAVLAATIIPYADHQYGLLYFIVVTVGVDAVIVITLISLWKNPSTENLNRISTILKYDMLVGLLAIYLG